MIADHTQEIQELRGKIAGLLNQKPLRRSRAKVIGVRLNYLVRLQLKRENKIHNKLVERRAQ